MSFNNASQQCAALNGSLTSVLSAAENAFLNSTFNNVRQSMCYSHTHTRVFLCLFHHFRTLLPSQTVAGLGSEQILLQIIFGSIPRCRSTVTGLLTILIVSPVVCELFESFFFFEFNFAFSLCVFELQWTLVRWPM